MKKVILVVALILVFGITANSTAVAKGPYVSGSLGLAITSDSDAIGRVSGITETYEFDNGMVFGFAVGYDLGNTRIEGEITYQENDMDRVSISGVGSVTIDGDASSTAFLLNGYYDFKNETAFITFVSAGFGFAEVEVSDIIVPGLGRIRLSDDDKVFAYQIGAGIGYAMSEKVFFDVKYRYFATSDPDFEAVEAEFSSHNIYAGIRVSF